MGGDYLSVGFVSSFKPYKKTLLNLVLEDQCHYMQAALWYAYIVSAVWLFSLFLCLLSSITRYVSYDELLLTCTAGTWMLQYSMLCDNSSEFKPNILMSNFKRLKIQSLTEQNRKNNPSK